jgi:hypothetical protein
MEYCSTLHEEHIPVAGEMMMEEISFSPYSLKLTTVVRYLSLVIPLVRKDVEVRLHVHQTKTEPFWLCVWVNCDLKKLHHC